MNRPTYNNLNREQEPKTDKWKISRTIVERDSAVIRRRMIRSQLRSIILDMTVSREEIRELLEDVIAGRDESIPEAVISGDLRYCFRCKVREIKKNQRSCPECIRRPACIDCQTRTDRYALRCIPCARKHAEQSKNWIIEATKHGKDAQLRD